jgi:hypothetical protein
MMGQISNALIPLVETKREREKGEGGNEKI